MRVSPPICPPITRWVGSGVHSVTDITQGAKSSDVGGLSGPRGRRPARAGMTERKAHSISSRLTPLRAAPYTSSEQAGVAELADAQDSGSCEVHPSCGFKSLLRYQRTRALRGPCSLAPASHLGPTEFATSVGANSQAVRRAPFDLRTAWVRSPSSGTRAPLPDASSPRPHAGMPAPSARLARPAQPTRRTVPARSRIAR